jgi:hypothetical protein
MGRPVGLDINGWRDYGCRDWSAEDPGASAGPPVTLDGGTYSVIVEHDDMLVGGPQAILSPIGRGQGWSDIGAASKRRLLAGHWSDLLADTAGLSFDRDMRAAAQALSRLADQRIFCMPDHAGMCEAHQNRLLDALSGLRERRPILLWRSVALVLGLLDSGGLPDATDGIRIGCLIHSGDGIERQYLVLRRLADHQDRLAPERAGPGGVCGPALGLRRLLLQAEEAVGEANHMLRETRSDPPRMAANLLFCEAPLPGEEIVRRNNGNWLKLCTPREFVLPDLADGLAELSVEADQVVLLSPLAERHRDLLGSGLAARGVSRPVIIAHPDTAARGALFAARRMERGIPHYLDRLDQISLIVMRGDRPVFEDLIPTNAIVPGNREYISKPITSMLWTAGMAEVQFYIRKGPREIRRWVTPPQATPDRNEGLEIQLRQMPAQGWARLSVTAAEWEPLRRAPIVLDWGALDVDPRTEAEILASLERPRPAVPRRVHYTAHIGLWDGSLRKPGLRQALERFRPNDPNAVAALAAAVAVPFRRSARHPQGPLGPFHPVGTDGELPEELDAKIRQRFFRVVERVGDDLLSAMRPPADALGNNDALRFLTWIFAACPPGVQAAVVAAFEAVLRSTWHPLLRPRQAITVVVHGLGRVVTDKDVIRCMILLMCDRLADNRLLAPFASLLSRPLATPKVLATLDVEAIAADLRGVLQRQARAGALGRDYKYALMVVAGLLRVREEDPWALTKDRSPAAIGLAKELKTMATMLQRGCARATGAAQKDAMVAKLAMTVALIDYLETDTGRPDILTAMEQIDTN